MTATCDPVKLMSTVPYDGAGKDNVDVRPKKTVMANVNLEQLKTANDSDPEKLIGTQGNSQGRCDYPESGFKKGHVRNDSGHIVITGMQDWQCDGSPPTHAAFADEIEKSKTERFIRVDTANTLDGEKKSAGQEQNETERNARETNKECESGDVNCVAEKLKPVAERTALSKHIFPVAFDISKLKCSSDESGTDNEKFGSAKRRSRRSFRKHRNTQQNTERQNSYANDNDAQNGETLIKTKGNDMRNDKQFVRLSGYIQEQFGDLVKMDFDVMDLCDYLFQYNIMHKIKYEEFFELSRGTKVSNKKDLKRQLMVFLLNQTVHLTVFERAVTEAGCAHVFVDIFLRMNTSIINEIECG